MDPINPYLSRVMEIMEKRRESLTPGTTMPNKQSSTLVQAGLDNVDCPKCNNTGSLTRVDDDGVLWSRECSCMKRRRTIRYLKNSGLGDLVEKCRFDNFKTPDEKYENIKQKAYEFVNSGAEWFIIMGRPGSGKTHICTAMCTELATKEWELKYVIWRKMAQDLKQAVNTSEYEKKINTLCNVPVLYIDDFFKGSISEGDINQAITVLNDRYNSKGKKTIISTELTMPEILNIDEALGSRIAEKAKGFAILTPEVNWRLS